MPKSTITLRQFFALPESQQTAETFDRIDEEGQEQIAKAAERFFPELSTKAVVVNGQKMYLATDVAAALGDTPENVAALAGANNVVHMPIVGGGD